MGYEFRRRSRMGRFLFPLRRTLRVLFSWWPAYLAVCVAVGLVWVWPSWPITPGNVGQVDLSSILVSLSQVMAALTAVVLTVGLLAGPVLTRLSSRLVPQQLSAQLIAYTALLTVSAVAPVAALAKPTVLLTRVCVTIAFIGILLLLPWLLWVRRSLSSDRRLEDLAYRLSYSMGRVAVGRWNALRAVVQLLDDAEAFLFSSIGAREYDAIRRISDALVVSSISSLLVGLDSQREREDGVEDEAVAGALLCGGMAMEVLGRALESLDSDAQSTQLILTAVGRIWSSTDTIGEVRASILTGPVLAGILSNAQRALTTSTRVSVHTVTRLATDTDEFTSRQLATLAMMVCDISLHVDDYAAWNDGVADVAWLGTNVADDNDDLAFLIEAWLTETAAATDVRTLDMRIFIQPDARATVGGELGLSAAGRFLDRGQPLLAAAQAPLSGRDLLYRLADRVGDARTNQDGVLSQMRKLRRQVDEVASAFEDGVDDLVTRWLEKRPRRWTRVMLLRAVVRRVVQGVRPAN
jgi:hypothetical protein